MSQSLQILQQSHADKNWCSAKIFRISVLIWQQLVWSKSILYTDLVLYITALLLLYFRIFSLLYITNYCMYSGICHWHALILALPVDKNPLLLVCKLKKQTNQKPKWPNEVRYVFIPFQIYFEFGIIKPTDGSVYPKSRLQKLCCCPAMKRSLVILWVNSSCFT